MPELILPIVFTVAIPLLAFGGYRLGLTNGRAGLGVRAAAGRAAGMIIFLALVVQLGGILGVAATALVPCMYLLGWGRARGAESAA